MLPGIQKILGSDIIRILVYPTRKLVGQSGNSSSSCERCLLRKFCRKVHS